LTRSWLRYIPRCYTHPKTVTHPSTNRAQRRVTSFKRRTTLPLRQATNLSTRESATHDRSVVVVGRKALQVHPCTLDRCVYRTYAGRRVWPTDNCTSPLPHSSPVPSPLYMPWCCDTSGCLVCSGVAAVWVYMYAAHGVLTAGALPAVKHGVDSKRTERMGAKMGYHPHTYLPIPWG